MPGKSQKAVKYSFNKMQLLHYDNTNGIILQCEWEMPELKLKKSREMQQKMNWQFSRD